MDALIVAEAEQVQTELEQGAFQPWFLYGVHNVSTVALQRTVPLPSGFISFLDNEDDSAILYIDGDGNEEFLYRDGQKILKANYGAGLGTPKHFSLLGDALEIFPLPDAVYSLQVNGYFADTSFTDVASAAENLWLKYAGDWLLGVTGARIARYIKDDKAAAVFAGDALVGAQRIHAKHIAWEETARDRIMNRK